MMLSMHLQKSMSVLTFIQTGLAECYIDWSLFIIIYYFGYDLGKIAKYINIHFRKKNGVLLIFFPFWTE